MGVFYTLIYSKNSKELRFWVLNLQNIVFKDACDVYIKMILLVLRICNVLLYLDVVNSLIYFHWKFSKGNLSKIVGFAPKKIDFSFLHFNSVFFISL